MGAINISKRITLEAPTHITLPNPPLEQGIRKKLTSLVPTYVDISNRESIVLPSIRQQLQAEKIHFIHLALAIQLSLNNWLEQLLEYSNKLPIRDEGTGTTVLHIAAKLSQEATLNILLRQPIIVKLLDEVDVRGTSPLIVAAWYGNIVALERFLLLGCETSTCINDTKKNALHCAADLFDTRICLKLLAHNNKKNFIDAIDYEGYTPLMIAARVGSPCVKVLLMAGADYKAKHTITGRNILHLAVLSFKNKTIIKLLKTLKDSNFISAVDFNGDTPFMLAIKLRNYGAAIKLLEHVPFEQLLKNSENFIYYIIKHDDSKLLELILMSPNVQFIDWNDSKGRTPLMYAVKGQNPDYVNEFLRRVKRLWYRNPFSGETVLHVAAYANDVEIMRALLKKDNIAHVIDISDFSGKTAYEIILGQGNQACYYAYRDSGFTIPEFINLDGESSLFIAAKNGNYNIMLNLLLSEQFQSFHEEIFDFDNIELTRARLQGRIYSSDIYIFSGEKLKVSLWNMCPDQSHLFRHNVNDENIFHACVKGENLMCLAFIYEYCVHFNKYWQELDEPNRNGATPLLLATKLGRADIFKYLVQHGAVMIKPDLNGKFPLLLMTRYIKDHHQLLLEMINECVVKNSSNKNRYTAGEVISISYQMFCPPGIHQLIVTQKMFEILDGEAYIDILLNPVVEYLIESKWEVIKEALHMKHKLNVLTFILINVYITLTLKPIFHSTEFLLTLLRLPTIIISIISIFLNLMIVYTKPASWYRKLLSFNILISPLCAVLFVLIESTSSAKHIQLGSAAVLSGGISIITSSYETRIENQVSIYYVLLLNVLSYMPLGFLVVLSFSMCFFVLFNDQFLFSTPLRSFLFVMIDECPGEKFFSYILPEDNSNVSSQNKHQNLMSVTLKILIVCLYINLFDFSYTNVMIKCTLFETRGNVHTAKIKVETEYEWESLSRYKCYKVLTKYNLHRYIGLINRGNLSRELEIPLVMYPLEHPIKSFDINRLKNIAISEENIKSIDIKFLQELMGYRERFM